MSPSPNDGSSLKSAPPPALDECHTLLDLLDRAAALGRGGLRFVDRYEEERFHSWPALRAEANRAAQALRARGLERGDRVGLVFPTSAEFVVAFFGTLAAGGIPVPLYPPLRLGRQEDYRRYLVALVAAAGIRFLLAERSLRRLLDAVAAAELAFAPGGRLLVLEDLLADTSGEASGPTGRDRPRAEEIGLLQFSSGTTSDPNPVALSHRALVAQLERLNEQWPDDAETVHSGVSWLPLYHDMGLVGFLLSAVYRPTEVTLLAPETFAARPALWLRAIGRHRATVSAAPSFAYALATRRVRDEDLAGVRLDHWKIALNGAEAVSPRVLREFSARFEPWGFDARAMTPVYGLAEATLAVTFSAIGEAPRCLTLSRQALEAEGVARAPAGQEPAVELVGLGSPLRDVTVEIRDPSGRSLPAGRVGRVWVESPSLMTGYFGRPERSAETLVGGRLDTGDLGFQDPEKGELFLVGRAKDILVLRGRNVAPEGLEAAVIGLAGVRANGVVAVSDAADAGEGGERLRLFVERDRPRDRALGPESPAAESPDGADPADAGGRAAGKETAGEFAERLRQAVFAATGWSPDEVHLLASGALPRTSSGKLRRAETLRRFRAGDLPLLEDRG